MLVVFLTNNLTNCELDSVRCRTNLTHIEFNQKLLHTKMHNRCIQEYIVTLAERTKCGTNHAEMDYNYGYDILTNLDKYPKLQSLDICWVVFRSKTFTPENFDKLQDVFTNANKSHKLYVYELSEKESESESITSNLSPAYKLLSANDIIHNADNINKRLRGLMFTGVFINYFGRICVKYDCNYVCKVDNNKLVVTKVHGKQKTNLTLGIYRRKYDYMCMYDDKPHHVYENAIVLPLTDDEDKDAKITLISIRLFEDNMTVYNLFL